MKRTLNLSALGALALILLSAVEGFADTAKRVRGIPERAENRGLGEDVEGEPTSLADILKTCKAFSVFAGTSVTFDGPETTVHTGDIGVAPGTSIEGNYVLKKGSKQLNNDAAKKCAEDQLSAFNHLNNQTCATTLPQDDLAGLTLTPGVYCSQPGTFAITAGTLTLDAHGDCNASFIFQTDTEVTTAEATSFILINGAQAVNVYWKVGTALTVGASASFVGNILTETSITIGSSGSIVGRTLAQAAVTFEGSGEIRLPYDKDEVQCESSPSVSPSTTSRASPSSSSSSSSTASVSAPPSASSSAIQSRGPTNYITVSSSPSGTQPGMLDASPTYSSSPSASQSVILKACNVFSVFAGTSITFDGPETTVHTGDIGVAPGTSIEGNYVLKKGSKQLNSDAAKDCAEDQLSAFNYLNSQTCTTTLPNEDLAGLTLTAGVYCTDSGNFVLTTSTLTLDAEGDSNAQFIFQTSKTVKTGTLTSFILKNGAKTANVYWKVGSALTLGTSSSFVGNVLAGTGISVDSSTDVEGRLLAQAEVTFKGSGQISLSDIPSSSSSPSSLSPSKTRTPSSTANSSSTKACSTNGLAVVALLVALLTLF